VQHHEEHWQTPAPATRYEYPYPARPTSDAPASTQRWSAQLARKQDTATQTYYELAFGDGRLQVMLTEPPDVSHEWGRAMNARPLEVLPADGDQAGPASWAAVDLRNGDSVRLAERILADADQQVAEMRHQATAHAAAIREVAEQEAAQIRQQASAQAAPIRDAAEREAAEIRQQATAQAAAIRAAAEQEADALRSAVQALSADLGQAAAYLSERLTGAVERFTVGARPTEGYREPADWFARPATTPETTGPRPRAGSKAPAPAVSPGADPATDPHEERSPQQETGSDEEAAPGTIGQAIPATAPREPRTKPAGPATSPGRRADDAARSRQRTMRVFAGSIAALVAVALGTGAYQLATRGYTFFVFRSAGTGSTDNNAVFPGIIPTPKPSPAHHHTATGRGRHGAGEAHHHHPRGAHHRVKGQ
jgi:hypothetical protein